MSASQLRAILLVADEDAALLAEAHERVGVDQRQVGRCLCLWPQSTRGHRDRCMADYGGLGLELLEVMRGRRAQEQSEALSVLQAQHGGGGNAEVDEVPALGDAGVAGPFSEEGVGDAP